MHLCNVQARRCLLGLILAVVGVASVHLAAAPAVQPKRATFEITNAFTIKVPCMGGNILPKNFCFSTYQGA